MLRKLGWWAVGVQLELLGVWISLLYVALMAMGVSLAGGHPALIVLAVIVGFGVIAATLGGPGHSSG